MFSLLGDVTWQVDAACAEAPDPDVFFPERGQSPKEARGYCETCPVKAQCLVQGVEAEEFGVWGGSTPKQRKKLRRAAGAGWHIAV